GIPIEYHHRTNRDGYKAGALQAGLETATGELIAIFDADFIPPPDFLTRTVHFFADPGVGLVQTRWSYLNRDYHFLTEVEAMLLPRTLKAGVSKRVMFETLMHLTPSISYPLMVVLSALMLPVMIVRFYMGVFQRFFLDMPLIIASFWSISAFYIVAQRELYPK